VPPRANPRTAKTIGQTDTKSRTKADHAHEQTKEKTDISVEEEIPRGVSGKPMMKIFMTASELVPTGQYANVSVGPAQITAWVDPDRVLEEGESYFSAQQRATLAQALNELAEIVEADVIAVQRNLVMENLQETVQNGQNK